MTLMWLIIAFTAGVLEACTTALVSVWFAVAAVIAAVVSALGASQGVQVMTFLLVAVILLVCTAPFGKKFRESKTQPTNADRLIGKIGVVTEDIDPIGGKGEVKVCGQIWSVQLSNETTAPKGTKVKVEDIVGAHLVAAVIEED